MAWWKQGLGSSPIYAVIGPNGFGKSTLLRKLVLNGLYMGRNTIWLADAKPDGRHLCELLGGQVIEVGFGHGTINPLDPGALGTAISKLEAYPSKQRALKEELHQSQAQNVRQLVALIRRDLPQDYEENIIVATIKELYTAGRFDFDHPPILSNLIDQLAHPSERMLNAAATNTKAAFLSETHRLTQTLQAVAAGEMGRAFNEQTSAKIDLDNPMVDIDISVIPESAMKLRAAVIGITGIEGQETVRARRILADHGLAKPTVTDLVVDETWQLLDVGGKAQIDTLNRITRLNRTQGVTLGTSTHSVGDYKAVSDSVTDQKKATGFISRSRFKFIGPVNGEEIEEQQGLINYTEAEKQLLPSWTAAAPPENSRIRRLHPGIGKFILKWDDDPSKPGIPFQVQITDLERNLGIHETSGNLLV